MIDIKFLRENPDVVKENIKKKFQDEKLILVDEVIDLDKKYRASKLNGDNLRSERKNLSNQIGSFMKNGEKEKAEEIKAKVEEINNQLVENEKLLIPKFPSNGCEQTFLFWDNSKETKI